MTTIKSSILRFCISLFIVLNLIIHLDQKAYAVEEFRQIAIQDAGRIKPFDTFSRETLSLIYGKTSYEGREAYEIVMTWLLAPELWRDKKIFEIRNHDVLKKLNLSSEQRYFAGTEVFTKNEFQNLMIELKDKRQTKEKLDPFFQAIQRLEEQMFVFNEIATGNMIRLIPPTEGTTWLPLSQLTQVQQEKFSELSKAFVNYVGSLSNEKSDKIVVSKIDLVLAAKAFTEFARSQNPSLYPQDVKMKTEVYYNIAHPFRLAYIVYLIAALILLFVWITDKNHLMKFGWIFASVGLFIHTVGFLIRVYLTGRAPVANMYETVIWVSWGGVLFSMILEKVYRFRLILMIGTIVAMFSLIVADFAPAVLDPSLHPLEPVLRSSYWLTIHVMTITISYAAFFLAFGLGDLGLIYYLRGEEKHHEQIKAVVMSIYRSMQIGVMFLAPGIILGGIWADYSWGRFWGWDPKETWALIALLGYLAVLHARLAGLIKNFGMIASAVITFSLVIMAWYGVNFVLGAGLHSYGFGAGGIEYVSAFIAAHAIFLLYVAFFRQSKKKLQS